MYELGGRELIIDGRVLSVPCDEGGAFESRGNLCKRGGVNGSKGLRSSHSLRSRDRTVGRPLTWSGCQCDTMMSETSGSATLWGLANADSRIGMYSSRPSPVSTRVYGFCFPIM